MANYLSSVMGASRICQFTFFTPLNPPDVLGGNHSYSLPLLRGGLGWGLLFMQKRDAPSVITTTIGLVIGVPIALAINDYQRKLQATETSKKLELERLSKEILLLQYINEELK